MSYRALVGLALLLIAAEGARITDERAALLSD